MRLAVTHSSLILTRTVPFLGDNDEVVLGEHQRGLVLVDGFPVQISLGWFAQYAGEPDGDEIVEIELWTQGSDGRDWDQLGAITRPFPRIDHSSLPREQELWGEVDLTVRKPVALFVALKANGIVLTRRLLVVEQRPT